MPLDPSLLIFQTVQERFFGAPKQPRLELVVDRGVTDYKSKLAGIGKSGAIWVKS